MVCDTVSRIGTIKPLLALNLGSNAGCGEKTRLGFQECAVRAKYAVRTLDRHVVQRCPNLGSGRSVFVLITESSLDVSSELVTLSVGRNWPLVAFR